MHKEINNEELFERISNPEALFEAWDEFKKGKGNKPDILQFEQNLEQNIFQLHRDLRDKTYVHEEYKGFFISDPKRRHIHKASVRDRVLHHAIFKALNPIFEPTFIPTSFSCRIGKGTHKGVEAVEHMLRQESKNYTHACYALKCDVKKFFDSIDHNILLTILARKIRSADTMWLLQRVIEGYQNNPGDGRVRGVPIGNLTSQLFANIYLGELDQYMKHTLKVKKYARYTDDFIVVSQDSPYLKGLLIPIEDFLKQELKLELHPEKVMIRKVTQGVDFLGYVVFPHHILLRKRTKRRIERKLAEKILLCKSGNLSKESLVQSWNSYCGVLSHANTHKLLIKWKQHYQIQLYVKND